MTSNAKAEGRFDKSDFIYIAKDDEYMCPAGERAIYRFSTFEKKSGLRARLYWTSACPTCTMKDQCMPSDFVDGSMKWCSNGYSSAWIASPSR